MAAVGMIMMVVLMSACTVVMIMMIMVGVVMAFAADVLRIHGEQIEQREHPQANRSREHHRPENAIRRQVGGDTTRDMEEEHHAAPKKEGGNAEKVDEGAGAAHKGGVVNCNLGGWQII